MTLAAHWIVAGAVSLLLHGSGLYVLAALIAPAERPMLARVEMAGEDDVIPVMMAETVETSNAASAVVDTNITGAADGEISPIAAPNGESETASATEDTVLKPAFTSDAAVPAEQPQNTVEPAPAVPLASDDTVVVAEQEAAVEMSAIQSPDGSVAAENNTQVDAVTDQNETPAVPTLDPANAPASARQDSTPDSVASHVVAEVQEGLSDGVKSVDDSESILSSGTNLQSGGDVATPVLDSSEVAILAPPRPPPLPKTDLSSKIAKFFQSHRSGPCFLISPKTIDAEGAKAIGIGDDMSKFDSFSRDFSAAVGATLEIEQSLIETLQCPALDLVKLMAPSRGSVLELSLERNELPDGEDLAAEIRNVHGKWLSVLVIDDEGMVSDVSKRVIQDGSNITLHTPVNLWGGGAGKLQLLLAIVSDRPLRMMEFEGRRKAGGILPLVMGEKRMTAAVTDVAIEVFRVR